MLLRKNGSEFVEAAIVIPLFILIVLSMISVMIYFFSYFESQIETHEALREIDNSKQYVFDIKNKEIETSTKTKGITQMILKRSSQSKRYIFNPVEAVRLGEIIEFAEE